MAKIIRLTESDLVRLVNRVINEQNDLSSKGFQKWGKGGYLMRLPKGSNNTNDAIRIAADLIGDKFNVIVAVQSNKKVRAEIKGNNVFKKIESILGNKFYMSSNGEWENTSGVVDLNTLDKIVNLLSSLKVDEKNNIFTESDLIRLVNKVLNEQTGVGHSAFVYLNKILKPYGFVLDEGKGFGVPTLYKGSDENGVFIQFYQDKGFYFQVSVTLNGREVFLKEYPLKESENFTGDSSVKKILADLEKWKNYKFPKDRDLGEHIKIS